MSDQRLGCDCYPGCWGDHSNGWPALVFDHKDHASEAWRRCHQTEKMGEPRPDPVPYGTYVLVGNALRFSSVDARDTHAAVHGGKRV